MAELEVMICAYGPDGISRVAMSCHPRIKNISYLVSWQNDGTTGIPKELQRDDFRIITSHTKGLAANRNIALTHATAPLLLIADDDETFTEEGLRSVIESFRQRPEADLIAFRYESKNAPKTYPKIPYSLKDRKKGHYISSIELSFRKDSVKGRFWFNENFGIGATFPSGEEDIFLKDCIEAGLNCLYEPKTIARHDGDTTSGRNLMLASRPQTKGAVFLHLYPKDWLLRMLAHAIREIPAWRKKLAPSPLSYIINWLKGANMARKLKVYPTPDYSQKYRCHE